MLLIYTIFITGCNCCCASRKCKDGQFVVGFINLDINFFQAAYGSRICPIPASGFGNICFNTGNIEFANPGTWAPSEYALSVEISTSCPQFINAVASHWTAGQFRIEGDQCDKSAVIKYALNVDNASCGPFLIPIPVFEGGSIGVSVKYIEDCIQACEDPATDCGGQIANRPRYRFGKEINFRKNNANQLVTQYGLTAFLTYDKTVCIGNCQ
ncbi:MAG: hypothetical protein IT259_15280 [Saprospiraceae bacterium]|nr:hypothetical protein [Saprospiraceae bacterium]